MKKFYLALIIILITGCENKPFHDANGEFASVSNLEKGSSEALELQKKQISSKLPLEIKLSNSGIHMRLIPAGTFYIGSPITEIDRREKEKVQEEMTIKDCFYIGKFEVTKEQWTIVHGYGGGDPIMPVTNISYEDCLDFCRKLEKLEGLKKGSIDLPTEMEWEYSARAGTRSAFYSQNLADIGWFAENSDLSVKAIGQKSENAWGLYDTHGNVWELTKSIFQTIPETITIRGGAYNNLNNSCRSSSRAWAKINERAKITGFRIILRKGF